MLVDANGLPLSVSVSGANTHDMRLTRETLKKIQAKRPDPKEVEQHLCLDKGYDYQEVRRVVKCFRDVPHIKARGEERQEKKSGSDVKARRWVVERTHSWLNRFRRLLIRWEKKPANYEQLLHFACAFICFKAAGVFG